MSAMYKSNHSKPTLTSDVATADKTHCHHQELNAAMQPLPHYMNTFWLLGEAVRVATGCRAKINSHNNKK